jgi:hypothetical protein
VTNEEFERHKNFMIEQQARFEIGMQRLQEAQAQHEVRMQHLEAAQLNTEQKLAKTVEIVGQTGEIVTRLANATLVGFKDVNAKIDALVDGQIRTDDALRDLTKKLDRHLSKGDPNNN